MGLTSHNTVAPPYSLSILTQAASEMLLKCNFPHSSCFWKTVFQVSRNINTATKQPKQSSDGCKKSKKKMTQLSHEGSCWCSPLGSGGGVVCLRWWGMGLVGGGWWWSEARRNPPPPVPKQPAVTKEPGRPTGSSQRDGSSERSNPFWPFCAARVLPPPPRAKLTEPEGGCASCGRAGACSREGPGEREADCVPRIALE